uniref:Uncharacterized protein LOC100184200 n=1 Tax=Phallusia mammillata TaxID=59560 RepID=A0A6F9DHB0_9ASCI|nr:uncharacterized protein LOC100184200 [Phallusia mammillata]
MDLRAEKFLAKIAQRLAETTCEENVRSIFEDAISSLPEKHLKLKNHITSNVEYYFKFYEKSLKDTKKSVQPLEVTLHPPKSFVAELLMHQNDTEKLVEILDKAINNELKSLKTDEFTQKLCNLAISSQSTTIAHVIANALYNFFENKVESELKLVPQAKQVAELQENIFKVILLLNHQFRDLKPQKLAKGIPKLQDILAALFSFYIDLSIHAGQSHCENQRCSLLEMSNLLFGENQTVLLDALSQVSQLSNCNAAEVLDSVYSKIILHHQWNTDALSLPTYLQLMLVVRQAIGVMKGHTSGVADQYRSVASKFSAPELFYKWVVGKVGGEDILDTTPITLDSAPNVITEYLLNGAELETIEDLVNLIHAGPATQEAPKLKATDKPESAVPDSLFFIDTKPKAQEGVGIDEIDADDAKLSESESCDDYNLSDRELDSDVESLKDEYFDTNNNLQAEDVESEMLDNKTEESHDAETLPDNKKDQKINVTDSESDAPTNDKKSTTRSTPRKRKTGVRTRTTPRQQYKVAEVDLELSSIPEELQVDTKCAKLDMKPKTRVRKTRSDSESSTGSHSYSTRSRSKNS